MSYVIYHKVLLTRLETAKRVASFGRSQTAKMVLTKAVNAGEVKREDYIVDTYEAWRQADHHVDVISAQDGKTVCMVLASNRGNPALDPSLESYWSM